MELRHLRYVVAVADTLHFGRAAARLKIRQPPLSQQIRQLEDELGVRLFDRTRRQVQLTAAGEMFVQDARLVLAQASHAGRVGERLRQGEEGQLVIGVAGPADADYFVEIMRLFAQRHSTVRVVVRNMSTAEQLKALTEERLHVGFVTPPAEHPDLRFETVLHTPIVLAVPEEHVLAARARVPLTSLAGEPIILFGRSMAPGFFDAIAAACRAAGFNLQVKHEVEGLQSAYGLVAAGLGLSLVPSGLDADPPKGVVLRPLSPALPSIDCEIALAYRHEPSCNLVGRFVDVVHESRASRRARKRRTA
jgi:DNA-binding transcriptional LysR family regulator